MCVCVCVCVCVYAYTYVFVHVNKEKHIHIQKMQHKYLSYVLTSSINIIMKLGFVSDENRKLLEKLAVAISINMNVSNIFLQDNIMVFIFLIICTLMLLADRM